MIPNKIKIKSDGNVLEYQKTVEGKPKMYHYKYTKSLTKKGMILPLTEPELTKLLLGTAETVN